MAKFDYSEGEGRSVEETLTWLDANGGSACAVTAELRFRCESYRPYDEASEFVRGQGLLDLRLDYPRGPSSTARCVVVSFEGASTPDRERENFVFYADELLEEVRGRCGLPVERVVVE